VRAAEGGGWLREVHDGRPIVTGDRREAMQLASLAEAQEVVGELGNTRWVMVAAEATRRYRRGLYLY
jgi:hypothetical protein